MRVGDGQSTRAGRYGVALLEGGSERRAYLLKERLHDRTQLVGALAAVAEGGSVVDSKVVEALIAARVRAEDSPLSELTPRELEILSELARGKSNHAIADQLVLSKRVVEKHINAIFLKLKLSRDGDVSLRVKAALVYLAHRPPQRAEQPGWVLHLGHERNSARADRGTAQAAASDR
jgi:DNA-binding CsgD family transcriptional regulator